MPASTVCEKMVRAWVQHHTVFKRSHKSTMIHWQTWDFHHSDSDHNAIIFFCSCISLIFMAVNLKHWRERPYLFIVPCLLCNLSSIHLPDTPHKVLFVLQFQTQALHGHPPSIHARHDKACPCDNSPLTLLFVHWSNFDCITRTSEKAFFSKASNSNCLKSTTYCKMSLTGKFWCWFDRVQTAMKW